MFRSVLRSLSPDHRPYPLRWMVVSGLAIGFASLPGLPVLEWHNSSIVTFVNSAAVAQRIRVEDIWQKIYQQLPDLPLENTYVNQETGDVSTNNTLVSRLIRYHIYSKGRSTNYRFDWKLTLADYLGMNERMEPATYPSGTSLKTNPIEGDRAAVRRLTRAQRDALVNALVSLFNPQVNQPQPTSPQPAASPSPVVTPSPQPSPTTNPRFPRQPQPGDADLLRP